MEKLTINTGLASFVMPDSIIQLNDYSVTAVKSFDRDSLILSLKLETAAQICALHTRYIKEFRQHAFLLKINSFTETSSEKKYGDYHITATLTGSGKSAFSYSLSARVDGVEMFRSNLMIAVTDYNETFQKQSLSQHYRSIFSCLTKNIQKN